MCSVLELSSSIERGQVHLCYYSICECNDRILSG